MKEGIFKMVNDMFERVDPMQFIVLESWKKTRDRLQKEHPTAQIKYSYKTKQFTIEYPLPSDYLKIISISTRLSTRSLKITRKKVN